MSNDAVADALAKVLARLDALEAKVDAISGGTAVAPAGDLDARLARIESSVAGLGALASKGPVVMEAMAMTTTEVYKRAEDAGIDPIATAEAGIRIAQRAAHPNSIALVEKLLDDASINFAGKLLAEDKMALADKLMADENVEVLDKLLANKDALLLTVGAAEKLKADGSLEVLVNEGANAAGKAAGAMKSDSFKKLLDSGALDPQTLDIASKGAQAVVETLKAGPAQPVGFFGSLSAMGDSDVQKAVGFTLAVAKRFGQLMA